MRHFKIRIPVTHETNQAARCVRAVRTLFILLLFCATHLAAPHITPAQQTHHLRCTRVVDGDTIIVDACGLPVRVRILGIDCPERGEPGGADATRWVKRHCEGKTVKLEPHGTGRYGRTLCTVWVNGLNVGTELLRLGLAEVYKK